MMNFPLNLDSLGLFDSPDMGSFNPGLPSEDPCQGLQLLPSYNFGQTNNYNGYGWPAPTTVSPGEILSLDFIGFPSGMGERLLPVPSPASDSSSDIAFSAPSSTSTTTSCLPMSDGEIFDHDEYVLSDEDDDGDYFPDSTRSTPRRRNTRLASTGRKARSASPTVKPPRKAPYSTSRSVRTSPPRRLHQVDGELADMMRHALKSSEMASTFNFQCPDPYCSFSMKNKPRLPDFKRHLRAHLQEADSGELAAFVCKGISMVEFESLSDAKRQAILASDITGHPYLYNGEQRIGGCCQSFSRADALTRHIKSASNACTKLVSGRLQGR